MLQIYPLYESTKKFYDIFNCIYTFIFRNPVAVDAYDHFCGERAEK